MWPAIIAAGASIVGGAMAGDAAEDAANTQAAAADRGVAEDRRQFSLSRRDLAPYRQAGSAAVTRLADLMGLSTGYASDPRYKEIYDRIASEVDQSHRTRYDGLSMWDSPDATGLDQQVRLIELMAKAEFEQQYPDAARTAGTPGGELTRRFTLDDFNSDPVMQKSYEFGLSEGQKAVQRMFGARGMSRSGAAVKAATRFATDYAGSKVGESRGRFYEDQDRTYNRLAGISGTGQTASTTSASLGANSANNIGSMIVGAGNARGAASIAGANAMAGGLSGAANSIMGQYNLDRILNNGGITGRGVPSSGFQSNAALAREFNFG